MYFDARAAKSLKEGDHIIIAGCPGLRLTATANRKTWIYRFKSPSTGLMKQIKIGAWPHMPPSDAATKWQELRSQRDTGEDIIASKKAASFKIKSAPDKGYAISELIADYSEGHLYKMRKLPGALAMTARLNAALEEFKGMPVAAVSRRFVFDLIESLSSKPVVAKSVKTEMAAAWEFALNGGRIVEDQPNWFQLVKIKSLRSKGAIRDGKHKGTSKRILTNSEIKVLMQTDMALFSQQLRDFLTLQLWTCTRGGEIVQMQPKHITRELDGVWWTVPKELTKGLHNPNATDLRVPLVGRALEIVERLLGNGQDWLFPSTSRKGLIGPQTQAYMSTKVNYYQPYGRVRPDHIRTRLTVTHWSPHDLRRTGRTMLSFIESPENVSEAILGHVKPGIIGRYDLYKLDKERRHWLTQLDAQLESLIAA